LLCAWAEERFAGINGVRALARHQWTPDLVEDIAAAQAVVFLDCSLEQAPGQIILREIGPATLQPAINTHHVGAPELLRLARDLYDSAPSRACLLTVGADSIEIGEQLSPAVQSVLPDAQALLELTVRQLLR